MTDNSPAELTRLSTAATGAVDNAVADMAAVAAPGSMANIMRWAIFCDISDVISS
jgi:hypothetical protein